MADTGTSRTALPLWQALTRHCAEVRQSHLRDVFMRDPRRFESFSCEAAGLLLDYSRQRVTAETLGLLIDLANEAALQERIAALLSGEPVNNTERRPALHTALRRSLNRPLVVNGRDIMQDIRTEREKLESFVRKVHSGEIAGHTGKRFETIVNIGIGGSDLGPVMTVEALKHYRQPGLKFHFVSNIDGCQLADVIASPATEVPARKSGKTSKKRQSDAAADAGTHPVSSSDNSRLAQAIDGADPETTLFIVCSKTFTTLETMTNARRARQWIIDRLGSSAPNKHFAAVSTNTRAMDEFGIGADSRFTMWDWVGGRYSIWSSIGLSLALAIGVENFRAFLKGGGEMDEHFASALPERNLPVLTALLGVWNRNFLDMQSLAVLPYDQRLHRFPAYLQQLEMESNGKRVTRTGREVDYPTAPILWGEPGSNAQHSFFQLLHQGTARVALDFLAPVQSSCDLQDQQNLALANCLAQAQAFALGQPGPQVRAELERAKLPKEQIAQLVPHKAHPGNRPSSIVLFQRLDPATLGKLIALYEHKVYVQSVIWDINPFDQWGVELGKKLADKLAPAVQDPAQASGDNESLRGLLNYIARWRR